jgi:hypothetical protein
VLRELSLPAGRKLTAERGQWHAEALGERLATE